MTTQHDDQIQPNAETQPVAPTPEQQERFDRFIEDRRKRHAASLVKSGIFQNVTQRDLDRLVK